MGAIENIESADTGRVGDRTVATTVDGFAIVERDPRELAASSSLDLDTYALARMVASEEFSGSALHLLVLAESTVNAARRRGVSLSQLLLRSTKSAANGLFSEQAAGKWASTKRDPNGKHVAAATEAQLGSNVVRGARDFFDPRSQDGGTQGGHALRITSEQYIAARAEEGMEWVGEIAGIDPYRVMLFVDVDHTPDQAPALAVLERGRAGESGPAADGVTSGGGVLALLLVGGALVAGLR